jgi:hypothetical protein
VQAWGVQQDVATGGGRRVTLDGRVEVVDDGAAGMPRVKGW